MLNITQSYNFILCYRCWYKKVCVRHGFSNGVWTWPLLLLNNSAHPTAQLWTFYRGTQVVQSYAQLWGNYYRRKR
jgi:hypothetical protein